jgi:hypothetical protein
MNKLPLYLYLIHTLVRLLPGLIGKEERRVSLVPADVELSPS